MKVERKKEKLILVKKWLQKKDKIFRVKRIFNFRKYSNFYIEKNHNLNKMLLND